MEKFLLNFCLLALALLPFYRPALADDTYFDELPEGLKTLLISEQTLNDRYKSIDDNHPFYASKQKHEFRPQNRAWFDVDSIWVPEEVLNVAEIPESSFHGPDFVKVEKGKRHFRLFIHPESRKFYAELMRKYPSAGSIKATATASGRTLLARIKEGEFFFLKLSLDAELGRVVRTISRGEVARSVGFTQYLSSRPNPNPAFHILPEPLAIIPKGMPRGGQILREIPKEAFEGGNKIVPLFSVYSKGKKGSLLAKMIKNQPDPGAFITEKILRPFAKAWVDWAVDGKTVMEAHAQNVLIQLDKKGMPTGKFYHRDMGGFNVDMTVEEAKLAKLPTFGDLEKDYHLKHTRKARRMSLPAYFENGFLANVDKELATLNLPRNFSSSKAFKKILAQELNSRLTPRQKKVTSATVYDEIMPTLDKINANNAKCGVAYQVLNQLLGK